MTKTRQEERLEELDKNQEVLSTKMDVLYLKFDEISGLSSKFDDLQATLKQFMALSQEKSTITSSSHDLSAISTSKSKATEQQVPAITPHDDNLCAVRRVEMPSFKGDDPLGWLARAEQYFSLQRTDPDKQVEIAFMCMEGEALHWLQWLRQQIPTLTWIQLKTELTEQFGGDVTASPFEQLAALHQTGSVAEFVIEFLARAAQIPLLDQHLQLGLFLNGLKDEIRVKFRPNDAGELRTAIHVARSIERELDFYYGGKGRPPDSIFRRFKDSGGLGCLGTTLSRTLPYGKGLGTPNHPLRNPDRGKPSSSTHVQSSSNFNSSSNSFRPRGTCQYSHQEYLDMKAKGLCFRCKQPYSPQHDCPYKSLRALMLAEDETIVDGEITAMEDITVGIQPWGQG